MLSVSSVGVLEDVELEDEFVEDWVLTFKDAMSVGSVKVFGNSLIIALRKL